jgi:hypothetical protein
MGQLQAVMTDPKGFGAHKKTGREARLFFTLA